MATTRTIRKTRTVPVRGKGGRTVPVRVTTVTRITRR